jgi:hypothetical protein
MNFELIQTMISDEKEGVTYNAFCKSISSYPIHRGSLSDEVIELIEKIESGNFTVEEYETYLSFDLTLCDRLEVGADGEVVVIPYEDLYGHYYQLHVTQKLSELFNEFTNWKHKLVNELNEDSFDKIIRTTLQKLHYFEVELLKIKSFKPYDSTIIHPTFQKIEENLSELGHLFKPKTTIELPLQEAVPSFTEVNNSKTKFNGMGLEEVRKHFRQLIEKKSKKDNKPLLTEKQFEQFITSAFLFPNIAPNEKIKMNFAHGEIGFIRELFYNFFIKSKIEYELTQHQKDKYIRLLTDYFEGFDYNTIKANFNKQRKKT